MNHCHYPLTIYYDGACPLCTAEMHNLMLRNQALQRLRFVNIASPGFQPPPSVCRADLGRLLHSQTADGQWLIGVPTFIAMYDAVGISWVAKALQLPVLGRMAHKLYPWFARHRRHIPSFLVVGIFEWALRRAAQRSRNPCAQGLCPSTPPSQTSQETP